MKTRIKFLFLISMWGLLAAGNLMANTLTLTGLPAGDTDTLSIQLDPSNGAFDCCSGLHTSCRQTRLQYRSSQRIQSMLGAGVSARSMNPCSAAVKQQYFAQ
jgi:hypothetical protein